MSKRKDKDKKKLDLKKETLRKLELTPEELQQAAGGLYTQEPPGTHYSRCTC